MVENVRGNLYHSEKLLKDVKSILRRLDNIEVMRDGLGKGRRFANAPVDSAIDNLDSAIREIHIMLEQHSVAEYNENHW